MHDIKNLEAQWKKYNWKKRRLFYLIPFLFVVLSGLTAYFSLFSKISSSKSIIQDNIKLKDITTLKTDKKVSLWIVNDTLNDLEIGIPVNNMDDEPVQVIEKIPVLEELPKKDTVDKPLHGKVKKKKIHLDIIETSSASAYKDVANRFHQTHDPDDSLFLAKAYFKKHEYQKAEYWALQTNRVNGNIEESWIIFIRSKLKQGYQNEAKKILIEYIKRTGSRRAKRLLEKISK